MTTLTFESIHYSPRKAAVRRSTRPAPRAAVVVQQPVSTALRHGRATVVRNKGGLAALVGLTLIAHVGVIVALHQPADIEPLPPKVQPLAIELAPPPPPPPEPPKVQPKIAKVAPAPVKAAPPLPVVSPAAVDNSPPTANTVQVATAPTPAPAPVVAAPPPPEPVTEPRGYIGYLNNPAPEYPSLAQDRGLQGRVILKVQVLTTGKPGDITVAKSSGHKILDDDAIRTVRRWVFDPARRGQTAIEGWVSVPLNYKLS